MREEEEQGVVIFKDPKLPFVYYPNITPFSFCRKNSQFVTQKLAVCDAKTEGRE